MLRFIQFIPVFTLTVIMLLLPSPGQAQDAPIDLRVDTSNPRVVYVVGQQVIVRDLVSGQEAVLATAPSDIIEAAIDPAGGVNYVAIVDGSYRAYYQPASGQVFQWFEHVAGLTRYDPEFDADSSLVVAHAGFYDDGRACLTTHLVTHYESTTLFIDRSAERYFRFSPTTGFEVGGSCPDSRIPDLNIEECEGEPPFAIRENRVYLGDEQIHSFFYCHSAEVYPSCVGDYYLAICYAQGTSDSSAETVALRADGSEIVAFPWGADTSRDERYWCKESATFTHDNRFLVWFAQRETVFVDDATNVNRLPFYYGTLFAYFSPGEPLTPATATSPMRPPDSLESSPHLQRAAFRAFELAESEAIHRALQAMATSSEGLRALFVLIEHDSGESIRLAESIMCSVEQEAVCVSSDRTLDPSESAHVLNLVTLINESNRYPLRDIRDRGMRWTHLTPIESTRSRAEPGEDTFTAILHPTRTHIFGELVEPYYGASSLGLSPEELAAHQAACEASGSRRCDASRFERETGSTDLSLDPFRMMPNEVSRIEYQGCVLAGECEAIDESTCQIRNAEFTEGWDRGRALPTGSLRANAPRTCVTRREAEAFCNYAGGRLPNEIEWESAAAGRERHIYPWGNEFDSGAANYIGSGLDELLPVGEQMGVDTESGLRHLVGNAYEWVSSPACPYEHLSDSGCAVEVDQGVLRGGSFASDATSLRTTYRKFMDPERRIDTNGFRCVFDHWPLK